MRELSSYIIIMVLKLIISYRKEIITVTEACIPGLNKNIFLRFYFSVYSLVFDSIEKRYQTFEAVSCNSQTPHISSKIYRYAS